MRGGRTKVGLWLSVLLLWATAAGAGEGHAVYQTSIINALLQGAYDGTVTIGGLRRHGGFGLGTVNGLDGELVGLDGHFYQVRSDGSVHLLGDGVATPFAVVTDFQPQARAEVPASAGFAAFSAALDQGLANRNTVVAVRVQGRFPYLKLRSVPRQEPPYRPLAQVVEEQTIFELTDVAGTLVGFRCPSYLKAVNVPGYHFHFLSDDRQQGGHVLDLRSGPVTAEFDAALHLQIDLPDDETFRTLGLGEDLSRDLNKVEQ